MPEPVTTPSPPASPGDRPWRGGQLGLGLGILVAPAPYLPGLWLGAALAAGVTALATRGRRWPGRIPYAVLAAAALGGAAGTLLDGPTAMAGTDNAANLRVLLRTIAVRSLVGGIGLVGVGTLIVTRSRRGAAPTPHRSGWSAAVWGVLVLLAGVLFDGYVETYAIRLPQTHLRIELRNLADAQRAYYETHDRFASGLADLPEFQLAKGHTVRITHADEAWWSARASSASGPVVCTVEADVPPAEERLACGRDRAWFR